MLRGNFFTVYTWPFLYLASTVYNSLQEDLMALARGHFQDSSTCGRFVQLSLQLLSNSASHQPLADIVRGHSLRAPVDDYLEPSQAVMN